jgi:serine/threonine-protein kinase
MTTDKPFSRPTQKYTERALRMVRSGAFATEDEEGQPARPAYMAGDLIAEKYRLARVLGRGGMGEVWLARNTVLDVDVAIKLLRRLDASNASSDASARLLQEARTAARLGHASIVRIFDFGQTDRGDPFIVMEVLEGESLADVLDRRGRLPALTAVRTLLPVASALEAAHAQGVIHRDMKPDNVVLVPGAAGDIVPKVVDFGIAKLRRDDGPRLETRDGTVLGCPDYMSPEQAAGRKDIDDRADVWGLAVMLYEAVTGSRPFAGDNYNALIVAVIQDEPTPITEFGAGDEALWAVVKRGLAKDVSERWPSMRAFSAALAKWAAAQGAIDDVAGTSMHVHQASDADEAPRSGLRDKAATIDANLTRASVHEIAARMAGAPLPEATSTDASSPSAIESSPSVSKRARVALALVLATGLTCGGVLVYGRLQPVAPPLPPVTTAQLEALPSVERPPVDGVPAQGLEPSAPSVEQTADLRPSAGPSVARPSPSASAPRKTPKREPVRAKQAPSHRPLPTDPSF